MGENSKISWTTHTFNPIWGCVKVSEACRACYAESLSSRFGFDVWGPNSERRTFGEKHWNQPRNWNAKAQKEGVRYRVFCASMADVFEDHPTWDTERPKLWDLISETPNLDWLLLTKRPENILKMVPSDWAHPFPWPGSPLLHPPAWPKHVWVGTTVENQRWADERIPHLMRVPAPVRFLSCEPLLGPVSLAKWLHPQEEETAGVYGEAPNWLICGGESGPSARPMLFAWARALREQCFAAGVPFFFKQGSQNNWNTFKDFDSFPEDLKIREFPSCWKKETP